MALSWRNDWFTASGCLLLALGLLIFPLRWVLAWLMAAAVHEGCHWLAVWLCGGSLERLRLDSGGAYMVADDLTTAQELICVLAGPLGPLAVLLPLGRYLPATAVCALFQSAYNLLPLENLDGGRALRCGSAMVFSEKISNRIARTAHRICGVSAILLGFYGVVYLKLGVMPLILSVCLVMKGSCGKIPCN